ncbi:hypothetical protein CARN8_2950013 [mine drainage metagenome]|uniref:Uncharacterized protein n=1 Tax=mine drainage metagenome TaxID=410659 RepID=A0A3P3ZNK2_9ZZZZ
MPGICFLAQVDLAPHKVHGLLQTRHAVFQIAHILGNLIHASPDMTQVFQHQVFNVVSHWSINLCCPLASNSPRSATSSGVLIAASTIPEDRLIVRQKQKQIQELSDLGQHSREPF